MIVFRRIFDKKFWEIMFGCMKLFVSVFVCFCIGNILILFI